MYKEIDEPLVHNLSLIDDFKLFGTVKFNAQTSVSNCIKFWHDFIRGLETWAWAVGFQVGGQQL